MSEMTMVERVARALCEADGVYPDYLCHSDELDDRDLRYRIDAFAWKAWEKEARAAIEAMREPTEAMAICGMDAMNTDDLDPTEGKFAAGWKAAIDAALA